MVPYLSVMYQAKDLNELLRQKGRKQSEVDLHHVYVSAIATGVRRAGTEAIVRMAAALGCTTDEVCAACDESFRRAREQEDLAAVENSPSGSAEVVSHADTVSGGAA
jgi:hypothetical protein